MYTRTKIESLPIWFLAGNILFYTKTWKIQVVTTSTCISNIGAYSNMSKSDVKEDTNDNDNDLSNFIYWYVRDLNKILRVSLNNIT